MNWGPNEEEDFVKVWHDFTRQKDAQNFEDAGMVAGNLCDDLPSTKAHKSIPGRLHRASGRSSAQESADPFDLGH